MYLVDPTLPRVGTRCGFAAWVIAGLCAVAVGPVQARPPDFPPPEDAKVSVVSENMMVQGRNMSVRAFISDDSVADVVDFYKSLWQEPPVKKAPGFAYEPDAIAPWQLVTRVEDGYVMTVQVQGHGVDGSYGYLALGRLPDPGDGPATAPQPPAMDGSTVLSNVLSDDAGKDAQTAMLQNEFSIDSNVNFYRGHYAGWRTDMDQAMGHNSLHALGFRRGREQVIVTIQSGRDGSKIVINSIKHDLL